MLIKSVFTQFWINVFKFFSFCFKLFYANYVSFVLQTKDFKSKLLPTTSYNVGDYEVVFYVSPSFSAKFIHICFFLYFLFIFIASLKDFRRYHRLLVLVPLCVICSRKRSHCVVCNWHRYVCLLLLTQSAMGHINMINVILISFILYLSDIGYFLLALYPFFPQKVCEHCSYRNAKEYQWQNKTIILAADYASNGIYNFIIPLRAHFRSKTSLNPIILLLERRPDVAFLDALSYFPLVRIQT